MAKNFTNIANGINLEPQDSYPVSPVKGDTFIHTVDGFQIYNGSDWVSGGSDQADKIDYDNSQSGLSANNVQDAIDELATSAPTSGANTTLSNLTSPVSFNQDLIPDTDGIRYVGSNTNRVNVQAAGINAVSLQTSGGSQTIGGATIVLNAPYISIDNNRIQQLQDPIDNQDAATKAYVDAHSGGGGGVNSSLSNLTSPTAINQHLIPNNTNRDLGSESLPFNNLYVNNIIENAHSQSVVNDTTIDLPGTEFGADYKSLEFQYYINRTGTFSTSPYDWIKTTHPNSQFSNFTYGNGIFVASLIPLDGNNDIAISIDGSSWTIYSSGLTKWYQGSQIRFGNGVFIRKGDLNTVHRSIDGIIWNSITLPDGMSTPNVSFVNGQFIIYAVNKIITSIDGISWETIITTGLVNSTYNFHYSNSVYIGARNTLGYSYSTDLITWYNSTFPELANFSEQQIITAFGAFYGIFTNNKIYKSIDGISWTQVAFLSNSYTTRLAYGNNNLIAIGLQRMVVSPNGVDFYESPAPVLTDSSSVGLLYGGGIFLNVNQNENYFTQIGTTETLIKDGEFKIYYDEFHDLYRAYDFTNGGDNNVSVRFQVNNTTKMITCITDYIADQVSGNIRYKLVRKL